MGLLDKLKNVFFEEVEEDEEEIEVPEVKEEVEVAKSVPMMFDVDDFYDEENVTFDKDDTDEKVVSYKRENREYNEDRELYPDKKEDNYLESVNNKPTYSYTKTVYHEERETKGFKPSPIISPIYGILDKNYRKEEVITKRETRISGTYSKPDLDSVRNKAFAKQEEKEVRKEVKKNNYSNEKKVYDVNNSKPQVSKVTLADADEYYNDLGLAYNVDYKDASRETTRSAKYNNNNKVKKEKKDVDDNLFDLIDSMYNKED